MGRQFRAPRRGASLGTGSMTLTAPTIVTSSSTIIAIPNYGITDVSTWTAGDYVLDAPEAGSRKTIVRSSSSTGGVVIRFSTGGTVSCGTLGTTAGTQMLLDTTKDACVVLLGVNSTHWAIETAWSGLTVNTTSIVVSGT